MRTRSEHLPAGVVTQGFTGVSQGFHRGFTGGSQVFHRCFTRDPGSLSGNNSEKTKMTNDVELSSRAPSGWGDDGATSIHARDELSLVWKCRKQVRSKFWGGGDD
jgi:hypothetical protein